MSVSTTNDIAVIGYSLRFPGAATPDDFWQLLSAGEQGTRQFSLEELRAQGYSLASISQPEFVPFGGLIESAEAWDNRFFGYSPKVAALMDPQQRLLLVSAWEAFEYAGYFPRALEATVGVYMSVGQNNYAEAYKAVAGVTDNYLAFTSNGPDFVASRISYHLNLKGPSLAVQTACSSSLVAVHQACESLLNHECDMALAGGASILFPQVGYTYHPNLIFSPDGLCRPFDAQAQGTVFSNGVGVILLKRAAEAIADKDAILAIIKGTAINNDGRYKNSYHAPSTEGQRAVIEQALAVAQVSASSIQLVEAHGTATPLGDPIEWQALTEVYGHQHNGNHDSCYVGSVKSNIGHLNNAAGIAGLLKAILALQHRAIPPTLHFQAPNPELAYEGNRLRVNKELVSWPSDAPRRAGVSSFGVGGTNAHVILEEFRQEAAPASATGEWLVLPFSAETTTALADYRLKLSAFLHEHPALSLPSVSHTLQQSRVSWACRQVVICRTLEEAQMLLDDADDTTSNAGLLALPQPHQLAIAEWLTGETLDWGAIFFPAAPLPQRVPLPTYAWQQQQLRIADFMPAATESAARLDPEPGCGLLGELVGTGHRFRSQFQGSQYLLAEHAHVLPAASYIEMLFSGLRQMGYPLTACTLNEIEWIRTFSVPEAATKEVFLTFQPPGKNGAIQFAFEDDELLVRGIVAPRVAEAHQPATGMPVLVTEPVSLTDFYEQIERSGFHYGPAFRSLQSLACGINQAEGVATVPVPAVAYSLDPVLLDAAFQVAISLLPDFNKQPAVYLPYLAQHLTVWQPLSQTIRIQVIRHEAVNQQNSEQFSVAVFNEQGSLCVQVNQFTLLKARLPAAVLPEAAAQYQAQEAAAVVDQLLARLVATELGYAPEAIQSDVPLERYGIESLVLVNLVDKLNGYFSDLRKTIFFEYNTLAEISDYLLKTYPEAVQKLAATPSGQLRLPSRSPASQAELETRDRPTDGSTDIAIIGVHGIYPQANDLDEYWQNLVAGKDCITEIPSDRWPLDGFYSPDLSETRKSYLKWGGFIDQPAHFDPLFFRMSPKETESIDPQERLFLESTWCAIENAGYTPQTLADEKRRVGVFAGVMWGHYQLFAAEELMRGNVVGAISNYWSIPNRASYTFDFRGPSLAVDTACSSSLSAIHMACQSILSGESDLAVAGGVNLNLHPYKFYLLSFTRFGAQDGRCRSFGEGGTGYVPGEGVGTLILKPLAKALADGDYIHGVIKGSSINHGGKSGGYTVPNAGAQADLITEAFANANLKPGMISYVEAHGTGTSVGDPIEMNGLSRAYAAQELPNQSIPIGSVKSNIGHLESAAGIAAVHKVLLQLRHRHLVPSLHSEVLNPMIEFGKTPFRVQRSSSAWEPSLLYDKRLAGISSFGAGGSNAHLLVEEPPARLPYLPEPGTPALIVLSAREPVTLGVLAARMAHYARQQPASASLHSMAYTLQAGRVPQACRLALVVTSFEELAQVLDTYQAGATGPYVTGTLKSAQRSVPLVPADASAISLKALGDTWVEGQAVAWELLYANPPQRVPLPNYPFNKKRLWVQTSGEPFPYITSEQGGTTGKAPPLSSPAVRPRPPAEPAYPLVAAEPLAATSTEPTKSEVRYFLPKLSQTECLPQRGVLDKPTLFVGLTAQERAAVADHFGQAHYAEVADLTVQLAAVARAASTQAAPIYLGLNLSTWLAGSGLAVAKYPSQVFTRFFELTRSLIAETTGRVHWLLWVNPTDGAGRLLLRSLGSFIRVVAKEVNHLKIKCIDWEGNWQPSDYMPLLPGEFLYETPEQELVYRSPSHRYQPVLTPLVAPPTAQLSLPEPRTALVTGGLGGVGQLMTEWLLQAGYRVVAVGRRSAEEVAQRHPLLAKHAHWHYLQADLGSEVAVAGLADRLQQYGQFAVFLHLAGIINDQVLLRKTSQTFEAILSPKVAGAVWLDQLAERLSVPKIIYASSVSAVQTQIGQADYATANRFLDEWSQQQAGQTKRQYLAVNWPYWAAGGMQQSAEVATRMQAAGIYSLTAAEGCAALAWLLTTPEAQVVLLKGTAQAFDSFFIEWPIIATSNALLDRYLPISSSPMITGSTQPASSTGPLMAAVEQLMLDTLCSSLGLEQADLSYDTNLEEYGVDSVVIMRVSAALETLLPTFSISLFFECRTIQQVLDKIEEDHQLGAGTAPIAPPAGHPTSPGALAPPLLPVAVPLPWATASAPAATWAAPPRAYFSVLSRTDSIATLAIDPYAPETRDHRVQGALLLAGAAYVDLAWQVAQQFGQPARTIRRLSWLTPYISGQASLEVRFTPKPTGQSFSFRSGVEHAKGEFDNTPPVALPAMPIAQVVQRCPQQLAGSSLYEWFRQYEFEYGPAYQGIEHLMIGRDEVLAKLNAPVQIGSYAVPPMLLDAAFQTVAGLAYADAATGAASVWVPFYVDQLVRHTESAQTAAYAYARLCPTTDTNTRQFDLFILDAQGQVLWEVQRFTLRQLSVPEVGQDLHALRATSKRQVPIAPAPAARRPAPSLTGLTDDMIAVVACSCRYPGADSPEAFWQNLVNEVDSVEEIPLSRWDYRASYDPRKGIVDKNYSKWGGFLRDIALFDNNFFGIKDADALSMDPQQRLLMEMTQHLLDRAGYTRKGIAGKEVAVIIGGSGHQWQDFTNLLPDESKRNLVVNSIQNMLAARISDYYDLRGTAYSLDTACSSSLVAIHEGCQKIRSGEADMAIAGGITLLLSDRGHKGFSQAQVLSEIGKCNVFDHRAAGIVLSEGAGLVLLKSAKRAAADGDQILAIIRGSAINNDGKTMGITTPNMDMQRAVIQKAIKKANVPPQSVTYLEAHGTGTLLGDPIEIKAASQAYGNPAGPKQYAALASVKSNIGHTLHASGIASLIKVVYALQHQQIPATLHCEIPHHRFAFETTPFYPVQRLEEWQSTDFPLRAGISSFGFGGTNCHMILEESPADYVATSKPLPLTQFSRRLFWPGDQLEVAAAQRVAAPKAHSPRSIDDIVSLLETGQISTEQALTLERELAF